MPSLSNDLQFVNIFAANKVAICSVDLLCLLNCVIATVRLPRAADTFVEGRVLASPGLQKVKHAQKKASKYC